MAERASIKDVAAAAGVSIKTVSRVVNGVPTVDAGIRDRVQAAVAALHYVPNTLARSLKTGARNVLGVVVDSLDDAFFSSVMSAVEAAAVERGFEILIASTGHDPAREREQVLRLVGHGVRGIVLAPAGDDHDYLAPYRSTMPVVAIDRPVPGLDSVTVDDLAAAKAGVELLLANGHRDIAFIGFDPRFSTSERRHRGYLEALAAAGVPALPQCTPRAASAIEGMEAVVRAGDPRPTALFLSEARSAPAVVATMHRHGWTDLAVVSFGDFPLADTVRPAITCIDQDPYAIGRVATERLLELLEEPEQPATAQVVPTTFTLRASHRTPAPSAEGAA